jgi:anti-sigma factor RsiW
MLDDATDMTELDADAERLEAMLDGELSAEQEGEVRARLEHDPALAARLEKFRQERALRQQVFARLQPSENDADRLLERVRRAASRERTWERRLRGLRLVGAAAACIVVGFMTGWMGRPGPSDNAGAGHAKVVHSQPASNGGGEGAYRVELTDEQGRVVAVQKFDTLDEARRFQDDLRQWQTRQQQVQQGDVMMIGDRF